MLTSNAEKRAECIGAIKALDKLKRELDMREMKSEYRRSLVSLFITFLSVHELMHHLKTDTQE